MQLLFTEGSVRRTMVCLAPRNSRTAEMVMSGIKIPLKNPAIPSSRKTIAAIRGTVTCSRDVCSLLFSESSYSGRGISEISSRRSLWGALMLLPHTGYPADVDTKLATVAQTMVRCSVRAGDTSLQCNADQRMPDLVNSG